MHLQFPVVLPTVVQWEPVSKYIFLRIPEGIDHP
jgi:hypothetical protein